MPPSARPVPGYLGYFVDLARGEVWSTRRRGRPGRGGPRLGDPRPLRPSTCRRLVTLVAADGTRRTLPARRVAAMAREEPRA